MFNVTTLSIIGAVLFGVVMVISILNALGFPLGEFSMGGKYKVIPPNMRILCWISVIVQVIAIIIILQTGNIIPLWFSMKFTRGVCFFFAVYLSLNSIMNFFSNSMKEKLFATPLSVAAAICFWIVAFSAYSMVNPE